MYILLCGYPPFFDGTHLLSFVKLLVRCLLKTISRWGEHGGLIWADNERQLWVCRPILDRHILGRFVRPCSFSSNVGCFFSHPSTAKDLIEHLLVVDPSKRYTAAKCLEHPWLVDEGGKDAQLQVGTQLKKLISKWHGGIKFKESASLLKAHIRNKPRKRERLLAWIVFVCFNSERGAANEEQ